MPTVTELSDNYAGVMQNPLAPGAVGICGRCLTFATGGFNYCITCERHRQGDQFHADLVVPISYAAKGQQLYRALRGYKSALADQALIQFRATLAAILWRWVAEHERCTARALGIDEFDRVTTVPSSDPDRDRTHPLRDVVRVVDPLGPRFDRLLDRSGKDVRPREVDPEKYEPRRDLDGEAILLVEDSWVTGSNAESAAGALAAGGAGPVAVLAIGRVLDLDFQDHRSRFDELPAVFDWDWCPYHVLV